MKNRNMKIKLSSNFNLQRRVISHMTLTSWQNIPHVSYIYEPDITNFYGEFQRFIRSKCKVSFNTIMLKVIVEGLLKAPSLNSHLEYNQKKAQGTIHVLDQINITLPWLLQDCTMITPTIINAEKMSLQELSNYVLNLSSRIEKTNINEMLYKAVYNDTIAELKRFNLSVLRRIISAKIGRNKISGLKGKEKTDYYKIPEENRITESDLTAGTVTVSNIGSLHKNQKGFFSLLEIIPPQVFAIGIGAVQEKPGIYLTQSKNKEIGIRKILPLCLVFDHRALDFNSIVPFIKRLDEIFENPNVIHMW